MANRKTARDEIEGEKCELEMTPMIDVTFLLLIFFMCTLKFKVLEGKLGAHLPSDVGMGTPPVPPVDKLRIQLRVVEPGQKVAWDVDSKAWVPYTATDHEAKRRYNYDDSRVIEYNLSGGDVTTDIAQVAERLKSTYAALAEESRVEIDPRENTNQGDVVKVMDLILGANITKVNFTGSFEN